MSGGFMPLSYLANLGKILESSAVDQLLVLLSSLVLLEAVGQSLPQSGWVHTWTLARRVPICLFPTSSYSSSLGRVTQKELLVILVVQGCHLAPWYIYMACMMVTPPLGPISCSFPLICLVYASLYGSVIASFKPTGRQDMTPPLWPPTAHWRGSRIPGNRPPCLTYTCWGWPLPTY